MHYNDDNTLDYLVRFNKGKWMTYDYSYLGIVDGNNGELMWSMNCSMGAMSSAVTVKSSKNGHDGVLVIATGCKNTADILKRSNVYQNEECTLDQHIESSCLEEGNRQKKDKEDDNNEGDAVTADELIDLWIVTSDSDTFPDPWTNTRLFIEQYCNLSYDAFTTDVFYLTPKMIASGNIKPIYTYKPYVYSKCYHSIIVIKLFVTISYFVRISIQPFFQFHAIQQQYQFSSQEKGSSLFTNISTINDSINTNY